MCYLTCLISSTKERGNSMPTKPTNEKEVVFTDTYRLYGRHTGAQLRMIVYTIIIVTSSQT